DLIVGEERALHQPLALFGREQRGDGLSFDLLARVTELAQPRRVHRDERRAPNEDDRVLERLEHVAHVGLVENAPGHDPSEVSRSLRNRTGPSGQSLRYIVTTHAPPRPRLCWSAMRAFGTWRLSAWPRSCQTNSVHCASPVAPSGWPFDRRPPDGFVTNLPPYVFWPSQMNFSASPSLQRPRPSYVRISFDVKQSWSSTTSTSF